MQRAVSILVVPALLLGSVAAFVGTEALKLRKPPFTRLDLDARTRRLEPFASLSPRCGCPTDVVRVAFRLSKPSVVGAWITAPSGAVVRRIRVPRRARGRVVVAWNGRTRTGRVPRDGVYHLRLRLGGRRFDLPNAIFLDTRPPTLRVGVLHTEFSPNGDGHFDRVVFRYHGSEQLYDLRLRLAGARGAVTIPYFQHRKHGELVYPPPGRRPLPVGRYRPTLTARDRAGNRVRVVLPVVYLRYIGFRTRPLASVRAGAPLTLRLRSDVLSVRWRLARVGGGGAAAGRGPSPRLRLRVPARLAGGLYRLSVRLPTGQSASTLLALRAARPALTALALTGDAKAARQAAAVLAARRRPYDALSGTDLRNLELLSGYHVLVAPFDALSSRVLAAYRATGGRVVPDAAAGGLARR